jgi:teichuronic acid exporter
MIQTILGFVVGVVLVATASVFMGLAEILGSLGMGAAVIQNPNLTHDQARTASTLSWLTGLGLSLAVVALAPLLADLFNNDQVQPVVQVMAATLLLAAIGAVPRGMLMKQLDFRRLFVVDLVSYLCGYAGLTLLLAFYGFGVWSLVLGALLSGLVSSAMTLLYSPVLPQWRFHWGEIKSMLHSGGGMSLNSLINYTAANVDYMMIGKYQDQHVLGLYSRAYHLVTLPLNKIANTLTSVMFPAYAEIQADPHRVKAIYLRLVEVIGLLMFPVMACFGLFGQQVIVGLYGSNWEAAVMAFQVLSLAGAFKVIFHLAGPVVQATGHVYREVRQQSVYLMILAVGCVIAAPYGIEAVSWVVVIASAWLYLAMGRLALEILGGRWGEFFRAQRPGLVLAAVVVAADTGVMKLLPDHLSAEVQLLLLVGASGMAYGVGWLLLPERWIGQTPAWLLHKYVSKLPSPLRAVVLRCRPLVSSPAQNR